MSSPHLPFLYQTRTIQRAFRCRPTVSFSRLFSSESSVPMDEDDVPLMTKKNAPFDWSTEHVPHTKIRSDMDHEKLQKKKLTLSPSEAHIFKNIFEEIAEGKMPRSAGNTASRERRVRNAFESPVNFIEHAQMTEFRDRYLERFPSSLRRAAERAMGLFAPNPTQDQEEAMSQAERNLWAERQKYQQIMVDERKRVEKAMNACPTDLELWKLMEAEVFSLPERLGIAAEVGKKKKPRKTKKSAAVKSVKHDLEAAEAEANEHPIEQKDENEKQPELIMDVHGALYSHYLLHGLKLFDKLFLNPSSFAFQVLPRAKSLGLTSYILGVSTPFFTTLARQHWERYGDATSSLDTLEELTSSGLFANDDALKLLQEIRDDLKSCMIGNQGPFAKALTQVSPFDDSVMDRIDEVEDMVQESMDRYTYTYGEASV